MEWNLKCIVVYLSFGIAVAEARSYRDCPTLRLKNGSVRLRPSGRMAKFKCNYSYQLVGNSYALCTAGRWEVPMPSCIKAGCKELPAIANGIHDVTHDGSLARFVCHYGFELEGSREIYCNGNNWNDTLPRCRGTKETSKLGCNFDEGMCGWGDDELHDFNWRRKRTAPNITHLIWWPSSDHTNSSTGQGGYVYIDRQSSLTNQSATLLSPSYHSDLTQNGCFTFYYYRSNLLRIQLRVYQKPDSVNMTTLTATDQRQKYLRFEATKMSYGQWEHGFFHLKEMDEDFQIVITGNTNIFHGSFLAVDDVMILQGHQCIVNITTEPTPVLDFRYSCANRCGSNHYPFAPLILTLKICGCDESCLQTYSCCADFRDLCEFGTEEDTTTDETAAFSTVSEFSSTTTKRYSETTSVAVTYPSSRNLVTQRIIPKRQFPDVPFLHFRSPTGIYEKDVTRFDNHNRSDPISETGAASTNVSTTTRLTPVTERTFTQKPVSTATRKVTPTFTRPPLPTANVTKAATALPTRGLPRLTVSTSAYVASTPYLKLTTSEVGSSTMRSRFYAGDGKTAQLNQADKAATTEEGIGDDESSYSYRMQVTTTCVAVFLSVCGASILIMFIVTRRDRISALITRLRIRHEFAKSSHVGKEGEVRFLIREDEVDLE